MCNIIAGRMISRLVLKPREAECLVISKGDETAVPASSRHVLTVPRNGVGDEGVCIDRHRAPKRSSALPGVSVPCCRVRV